MHIFFIGNSMRFLKTGKKMYCLMKEDCASVIGSKYGTSMGLKNEIIGMAFYLLMIVYSLLNFSLSLPLLLSSVVLFAALMAVGFSVYLLFVQSVILKTFCSWCLIAIGINFLLLGFLLRTLFF